MATSTKWYGLGARNQWGATAADRIDVLTDTLKVALVGPGYNFDQDAHDYFADITDEITDAGYTAGGATLGTKTLTYDTGTKRVRLKAANPTWTLTGPETVSGAVLYKDTGVAATSPLMGFINFDPDRTITSGTLEIQFDGTDGYLRAVIAS